MSQAIDPKETAFGEIDLALEPRVMFDGAGAADISGDLLHLDQDSNLAEVQDLLLQTQETANDVSAVFVVDGDIENLDQLLAALPADAEVLVLNNEAAGFEQIADFLSGRNEISALHIFSHGKPGALDLGASTTTLDSLLGTDAAALEQIGRALGTGGDILIYGCDFGAGENGQLAIAALATLTGADISASDDVTGHESLGGDWHLEVTHGDVEASAIKALDYQASLAVETTDGTVTIRDIETAGAISLTNDGGGEITTNIATPRGVEHMVERVWQFGESSETGDFTLVFDVSGITGTTGTTASDFAIILSDQADLSGDPLVLRASGGDFVNGLLYFHKINIANGSYFGFATQTETDNIELASVVVLDEDGVADLGLVVQPDLTDGGKLPDTFETAVGFRPSNAGTTPTEFLIPAGTTNITITGFSNEPDNTNGRDDRNDDYQTMNVAIDVAAATSGGSLAYIIDQGPNRNDQFGWSEAPLGADVLSGGGTISGNTGSNISPTFSIENGVLKITENSGLQTSYLVEFQTTLNTSANFLGSAAGLADKGDTSDIVISIPAGVDVIKINQTDAAAGSHSAIEYKGFSKHYVDVGTGIGSGTAMAQLGETANRVAAFAYEDYTLGPQSLQSSGATVLGDTGSTLGANNDLTYFINGAGDLVIQRDATHAAQFSSMFTVEFYERVDLGSSADAMGVVSDEAFFDANRDSGEAELAFAVPEGAKLGIMNLSLGGTRNSNENENTGGAFAIIDLAAGTTSGNFFTVRVSNTVDLLSWEGVPFGTTMFDVVTGAATEGEAASNKTSLNQFKDEFGARARFEIETAGDGSQTVKMFTDSLDGNQTYLDYNAFAQVQWLGSEPISLGGIPSGGTFSVGALDADGNWAMDIQEAAKEGLLFTPPEHFSDTTELSITVSVGPETASSLIIHRPVIDPISFDTAEATGLEDTDIAISAINDVTFVDDDGSETVTATKLSGITIGHTISDGANSFTASAGNTSIDISSWNTANLTYNAGPDVFGDFPIIVDVDYQDVGVGQVVADTANGTFTVHILPVNDVPETQGDYFVTAIDGGTNVASLSGSVAGNDSDPEGEALTFALETAPSHGTLVMAADGSFTYSATVDGTYTFSYRVTDASGGTIVETANTILVSPLPSDPVTAVDDSYTMPEDGSLTGNVITGLGTTGGTGGTADTIFGPTAATLVSSTSNGVLTFNDDGSFTYVPNENFTGTGASADSFVYSIDNGRGPSTATVTIDVTPVNDPPEALPDAVTTHEDTAITVSVLDNDSDIDGDTLSVVAVSAGTNITPSIVGGSTISFTPVANWSGSETFTYTIQDPSGSQTTSTVKVTVTPALDAPDSADKTITVVEDTIYTLTFDAAVPANGDIDFIDPDTGDSLQSVSFAAPSSGTLLVAGTAVTTFPVTVTAAQLSGGQVAFKPAPNDTNNVTLDFTVNDGQLADDGANTLTFTITPVNDPIALTGAGLGDQTLLDGQTGVSIATDGAFTDIDNTITNYAISSITNAAGVVVTPASLGLQINGATGEITEVGAIDHLASADGPYVVTIEATSDDTTTASESFQLTISNPVPTAANGGSYVYNDGDPIAAIPISTLFTDADGGASGDTLTITLDSGSLPATLTFDGTQITGTVAPTASVNETYTAVFKGEDEQGAEATTSVSFTINNPAPKLVVPPVDLNQQNADAQLINPVNLSTAFIDDDALTFSATGLPAGLSMDANGVVTGTLDNSASQGGVSGSHTVIVVASDPQGKETETSFTWLITNPAPTSAGAQAVVMQDSQTRDVNLSALFIDSDADDLTFSFVPQPAGASPGTVSIVDVAGVQTLRIVADTDASQNGDNGNYTLAVTADDTEGGTVTELVTVTVTNPPPVVDTPIPDQVSNDSDVISLDLSTLFEDLDTDTLTITDGGTLTPLNLSISGTTLSGTVPIDASQNGSPYTVTLTGTDSDGDAATFSFEWTVNNPLPVAATIPDLTLQDLQSTTIDLASGGLFTDPDGDALGYTLASDHAGLTITPTGGGGFTIAASSNSASQQGLANDGVYTLTATATDADGASVQQTFKVTVENIAPTSTGLDDQTADDRDGVNLDLADLGGFIDGAPDTDALTFSTTSTLPPGLSLSAAGVLSGTLDHLASDGSPYVITIEANDGQGGIASESFVFNVNNPAPTISSALPDIDVVNTNIINIQASNAFTDADGAQTDANLDDLTYAATGLPGNLAIDADTGAITGTISDTQGPYSVFVTATDSQGASVTDAFLINLNNSPPVSQPIADQPLVDNIAMASLNLNEKFTDPDGDGLTITIAGRLPDGLSYVNGVISGTPAINASQGGASGSYPITVTAVDQTNGTATQNFTITVTNPVPTGNDIADQTVQDAGGVNLNLASIGGFADEDALNYTLESHPSWVELSDAGLLTGTVPNDASASSPFPIAIRVTDADGAALVKVFNLIVENPAPVTDGLPNLDFEDGDVVSINLAPGGGIGFSDPDGDTLTYSTTSPLPDGLSLNQTTGLIAGTLGNLASETASYPISITATDAQGSTVTETFTIGVTNPAPTISGSLSDFSYLDGETIEIQTSQVFTDAPDGDTLSFQVGGLPVGLTIDEDTGVISGTLPIDASVSAPYTISVLAEDQQGAQTEASFTLNIGNIAPVAPVLEDVVAIDGQSLSLDVTSGFTDADGDINEFSVTGLPAGLSFDPATGLITGALDKSASQSGPYSIAVTSNDNEGGVATASFSLTVTNPAPTLSGTLPDIVIKPSVAMAPADLNAFVDPDGDAITLSVSGLPAGLSFDPKTGLIGGTPDNGITPGSLFTINVTATDADGAHVAASFTIQLDEDPAVQEKPSAPLGLRFTFSDILERLGLGKSETDKSDSPLLDTLDEVQGLSYFGTLTQDLPIFATLEAFDTTRTQDGPTSSLQFTHSFPIFFAFPQTDDLTSGLTANVIVGDERVFYQITSLAGQDITILQSDVPEGVFVGEGGVLVLPRWMSEVFTLTVETVGPDGVSILEIEVNPKHHQFEILAKDVRNLLLSERLNWQPSLY